MDNNYIIKYKPSVSIKDLIDRMNKKLIISDPDGSYTGKPIIKNEKPVQDADDL